jgi:CheY-like chemotaxis protein/glycine cleavage system H lipoate-binding protein
MTTTRDILVIDDEEVVGQAVARICGGEGLTVDTALSGAAGLDRLARHAYRLVLCDIMMGDLGGFEVLKEARRRGRREPIVMTTGYSTVEHAVRSVARGAVDCLPKPFTADELLAVVRRGLMYGRFADPPEKTGAAPCPPAIRCLGRVSWLSVETEGTVRVGAHEVFARTVSGVRNVDLLPPGSDLVQGRGCAAITASDGSAHALMCPVSGQVLEANAAVMQDPGLLERDPYAAGWLYSVVPADLNYNLELLVPEESGPGR